MLWIIILYIGVDRVNNAEHVNKRFGVWWRQEMVLRGITNKVNSTI